MYFTYVMFLTIGYGDLAPSTSGGVSPFSSEIMPLLRPPLTSSTTACFFRRFRFTGCASGHEFRSNHCGRIVVLCGEPPIPGCTR